MTSRVLTRAEFRAASADMCNELTEATLEEACEKISAYQRGYGFMCFRRAYLRNVLPPRERKEFVLLFEGDQLVGQLILMRPWDARELLPYVERIHPDNEVRASRRWQSPVPPVGVRVQHFTRRLDGRYVLEGT